MKTIIKTSAVFLVLALLTSSCYTYVFLDKSVPPEITLEKPKNSIAFINSFDYTIPDSSSRNETDIYRSGITSTIDGLKTSFAQNEQIDFKIIDTLVPGKAPSLFPEALSDGIVKDICRLNNSSMLLVLETFEMNMEREAVVEEYDDGSKSRTNNYYLIVNAGLSLYSDAGNPIDRSVTGRSEVYTSRPALVSVIGFTPSLYKAETDIKSLAKLIGEDYVNKFYPGKITVNRKIYAGKDLLEADNYCMEHNWEKAIELLKPLAESSDPKLARKAANNLSVAYEALGNEQAAEYWFNKSGEGAK